MVEKFRSCLLLLVLLFAALSVHSQDATIEPTPDPKVTT